MIAALKGTVMSIGAETVVIDVQGVGYEAYMTPRLLQRLAVGEAAMLAIETIVREDLIRLYGFENEEERSAFRLLQGVQGVGAKHALAILQVLPPADLFDAISAEDVTAISRAHGVGKKIAQRIAAELQTKVGAIASAGVQMSVAARKKAGQGKPEELSLSVRADAVSALSGLGYDGVEARRAVAAAAEQLNAPGVEELIKAALKQLAAA